MLQRWGEYVRVQGVKRELSGLAAGLGVALLLAGWVWPCCWPGCGLAVGLAGW